jgi:hypothetical protein
VFRRAATIGAVLAVLGGAAALAPTAEATKPCPVKYCTDSTGKYVLTVPPLTDNPVLSGLADCVWDVRVTFGDGTEEDYVFDASVGLTGSHTFPTPGMSYVVQIHLGEGHHAQGGESCPEYDQVAEVLYRTPGEEEDEPVEETPTGPTDPPEQGGAGTGPVPVAPTANAPGEPGVAPISADPDPYWRRCRGAIRTHLVSCRKGRRVAGAATAKLTRPGSAKVSGFTCRLPAGGTQPIVCARRAQRILLPG